MSFLMETRLQTGISRSQGSTPGSVKRFFSYPERLNQLWGDPTPYPKHIEGELNLPGISAVITYVNLVSSLRMIGDTASIPSSFFVVFN
jgi:hypothetical protein